MEELRFKPILGSAVWLPRLVLAQEIERSNRSRGTMKHETCSVCRNIIVFQGEWWHIGQGNISWPPTILSHVCPSGASRGYWRADKST